MVHPDVWVARDDVILAVAGLLMAGSHVAFAVLIVLWFALRKPTSWALFKLRLRAAWKRQPLPERLPNHVTQVSATWRPSDLPPSKLWP